MFLPAEDLAELVADMGTDLNEDEIYEMIRAADSDGDGQVSLEGKNPWGFINRWRLSVDDSVKGKASGF